MPNETQKKINEAEKGEKGKKSSYKRTTFEKNADFELIMEMCLTGKSRNHIRGEFKDTKPHRNYTLHWQTVDRMMRKADEEIAKHTPRKDRSADVKESKAMYKLIQRKALEANDLRTALGAQDKMDYHHISKQPDQINIEELRLEILGGGGGMEGLHVCGSIIEQATVRYQYVGQDDNGKLVVYAEKEVVLVDDLKKAEGKVKDDENIQMGTAISEPEGETEHVE